ncbi:MAG: ATP-dependent Zn protease [Nitrosomonas sp.]|nr:MAG: ATP-dependent Zn protease [Nitrosomonas sp.]
MHYTSLKNFILFFTDSRTIIQSYYVRLNITRPYYLSPASIMILIALSGCKTADIQSTAYPLAQQQNQILEEKLAAYTALGEALSAREAEISAREKELVDLYAELVKEKKALAASKANHAENQSNPVSDQKTQQTIPKEETKQDPNDNRIVLGGIENVFLDPPNLEFSARIDTGAKTSSLNAVDMVEFERDGDPYVKFHVIHPETDKKIELTRRVRGHVRIKDHKSESRRRPIVSLRVKLANIDERISFTLVDRSKFSQQVLLGRNFLRDLAVVDVSKKNSIPSVDPKESESK